MPRTATLQFDLDDEGKPHAAPLAVGFLLRYLLPPLRSSRDLAELGAHIDDDLAALQVAVRMARETAAEFQSDHDAKLIPFEDALTELLQQLEGTTETAAGELHHLVADLPASPCLAPEQKTALGAKLDHMAGLLRELRGVLQDQRWAIMEHNASLETADSPEFETVDELWGWLMDSKD
jgi:hypothetical protein